MISRLSTRLVQKTKSSMYGPEDQLWRQFVTDHKQHMRSISEISTFTTTDLVEYKFRPEEFYVKHGGEYNQAWIFLLVNDIRERSDFNETIQKLWMISPLAIKELRRRFEASAQFQAAS